jgi:hypothetical protein
MTRLLSKTLLIAATAVAVAGCAPKPVASVPVPDRVAIEAQLRADIATLSSNEFGGRKPGTVGEQLTTGFIIEQLQAAGLQSGTNDPGSEWLAMVPLVSSRPDTSHIVFTDPRGKVEFGTDSPDAVAFTSRRRNLIEQGDVVFVGKLGEAVPEQRVSGKVVIMLGEPGVSPARRAVLFDKGPAAILTVVENEEAITNVRRALGRERIELISEEPPQLSGYVTQAAMERKLGKKGWEDLLADADKAGFKPWDMTFKATVEATSQRIELRSNNVIGRLPGTKPGSGAVLLLAHWDHLGECGPPEAEDRICNGAVDNASGIAVMLELARQLAAGPALDRDVYVLATSAEEAGLLGARSFANAPPIPLEEIVAAFNFDTIAVAPAGGKVGFIGEGETPLDDLIRETVAASGRELGDKDFANSFVRRQDGWVLTQEGVPAVMLSSAFASEIVLGPYLSTDYHRATDQIDHIELGGAIDDLLLHEELVRKVANTALYPAGAQ